MPPTTESLAQVVDTNNDNWEVNILINNNLNILELVEDNCNSGSVRDDEKVCTGTGELQIVGCRVSKLCQLGKWATENNINHNALSPLLGLLRQWMPFEGFPKDPRTLLETDRN